jgi:phosphatidylserine decarboxylase
MKMPLTKFGLPQVAVWPGAVLALMVLFVPVGKAFLGLWAFWGIELLLCLTLVFVLAFFRDPARKSPVEPDLLLAPADGTITDVEIVGDHDFIGGPALRIGIFLSVFNVHINRAPCDVKVESITYRRGKKKNALKAESSIVNESNDLGLVRTQSPCDRLMVRQISGAIARRIVCAAQCGEFLIGGEKFGMIKFGSRTELFLPARDSGQTDKAWPECLVKPGDKVKAGISPLVRYEKCQN